MTKLLFINKGILVTLLFLFGCSDDFPMLKQDNVYGCTDATACNFNSDANIFDNSCFYAEDWEDECGVCDLDTSNDCAQDECGVWGGDGVDIDNDEVCDDVDECIGYLDCDGVCNGSSVIDNCGVCDDDILNDCIQDCNGDWGGNASFDNCGDCDDKPENDCIKDCNGVWGGDAQLDCMGNCYEPLFNEYKDVCGYCVPYFFCSWPCSILYSLQNLIDINKSLDDTIPWDLLNQSDCLEPGYECDDEKDNCRVYIDLSDLGLTTLPDNFLLLQSNSYIVADISNNKLCDEYYEYEFESYEIDEWIFYPQDQSNCCEGVNDEGVLAPNWTQCD